MLTALPINLDDLIHARSVEAPRIELKGSWNPGPTGWQVLHSICAFANDIDNLTTCASAPNRSKREMGCSPA
jgi:ATP-dependent DNA helicase RecG